MELKENNPRKSLIELEKEVFKNAFHVEKTYSNKRRKTLSALNRNSLSFHHLPGDQYPPLTEMDQQRRSTRKVEQWLQNYNTQRQPFVDLNPNVVSAAENKKMCLRSFTNSEDIENAFTVCEPKPHLSLKKARIQEKQLPIKKSKRGNKVKTEQKYKSEKLLADNEEVISIHESISQQSDKTIVIEDSQEMHVDKDHLAWLEVLRQDANTKKQKSQCNNAVLDCLQQNINSLRVEVSLLEPQVKCAAPIFHQKDNTIIWSQSSLEDLLNNDASKISTIINKYRTKSKIFKSNAYKRNRSKKFVLKSKTNKRTRMTSSRKQFMRKQRQIWNTFQRKRNSMRNMRSVGVQVDTPCGICSDLVHVTESEPDICLDKETNLKTYKENNKNETCRSDEGFNETCEIYKESEENDAHLSVTEKLFSEFSDSESSAHNASGNYTIKVQFHATMDSLSPDASNSDICNTPHKLSSPCRLVTSKHSTPSRSSDENGSVPKLWEGQYRTPTRGSPTYTITPPSNSSSNKENYAPVTPPKNKEKLEKNKKDEVKTEACRALNLLFEAPRAKVHVVTSNLQPSEVMMVKFLCDKLNWVYCEEYSPNVTHLVMRTDDANKAERNVKYICAVAASCWVVSYKWVEQCIREDCHLTEESFVVLDCSGEPGPLLSRSAPAKLFSSFTFCCLPSIATIRVDILTAVVEAAGARTVRAAQLDGSAVLGPVVVLHELRHRDSVHLYQDVISEWKVTTAIVNYEWVLECVGRYRLLPVDCFLLPAPPSAGVPAEWLRQLCPSDDTQQ